MLQDGENELVAEVTNTLAKAHHDNNFLTGTGCRRLRAFGAGEGGVCGRVTD